MVVVERRGRAAAGRRGAGPADVSTLLVSDLHLDGALPEAIAQFESFLSGPARAAEALYILGDLFESWVGDDDDDPDARACVRHCAHSLAPAWPVMSATAIAISCWPRDSSERTGCRILADPTIVELYGERVLLTHGDALCTDDTAYQRLRSIVRTAGLATPIPAPAAGHPAPAGRRGARRQPQRTPA